MPPGGGYGNTSIDRLEENDRYYKTVNMSGAREGTDIDEVVNKPPIARVGERFYSFFLVFGGFAISVMLVQNMKYIYVHYSFNYPLWLSMTHQLAAYIVALIAVYG